MMQFFRSLAKSKLLGILLGLPLIAGLLTIGNVRQDLQGLFSGKDTVIQAGAHALTTEDFKSRFENFRRAQSQQGQNISPDDAVAQGIDVQMTRAYAEQMAMAELLRRLGIWPGDKQVLAEVAKVKAFQDPVSGKFDQKAYLQTLAQNNLTPAMYEKQQRDELAYTQFASAAAAGLKPPRLYGTMVGAYSFEAHNLTLFSVKPAILGAEPVPTDADLLKLMKDHAATLTVPETRTLTVVKFSAAELAPTLTADPAEVKKRYDFRKDTLGTPEKRSLLQISAKDSAQAIDISRKLKAGGDPAAVAKTAGLQPPLVYTDVAKNGVADSKVGQAAFGLPAGAVSDPIQGNLGWAVIKVTGVTPGKVVTFDDAKAEIEKEVKTEQAATKAYDIVQKYQDAHEKGSTLVEAAKAANVTPQQFAPVIAEGTDVDGKPVAGLTPRMLKEAFALPQGGETDAVQDAKGEYFALRVDKVMPPALPALEKIRPRLVQAFLQQEMSKRLDAKLNELKARVEKGETIEAVAKSVGSDVVKLSLTRNQAQQSRNVPPQLVAAIFNAKPGQVITTGSGVAKVDSIAAAPAGVIRTIQEQGQLSLARGIFDELQQESRAWAAKQIKPKINQALARSAIGATAAASGAAPAGGPPAPAK